MDSNDWRLTNQEKYMKNLIFIRKKYDGKDHDHCSFCWSKFGYNESDISDGYCSIDGKHWVCDNCFKDFQTEFGFKVKENSNIKEYE